MITPLTSGLINHSYKVSDNHGKDFLLQQVNQSVFTQPLLLTVNYRELRNYLKQTLSDYRIPAPLPFADGRENYIDEEGNYWRLMEFIPGSISYLAAETTEQVAETASTFAAFTKIFSGMDASKLKETIPGFHDLSLRYTQFITAADNAGKIRMDLGTGLINFLLNRKTYVTLFEYIRDSGHFPLRVMHHDAKMSNILFDESSGKLICPVDFDTTMPGYFFSDPGDMIRSMVSEYGEVETDLMKLSVRPAFYEAICNAYLTEMDSILTDEEKKYFHYAGLLMLYMQALRFAADFLNDDVYYKISYPKQNFDRAMNQLTLLIKLEDYLKKAGRLPAI